MDEVNAVVEPRQRNVRRGEPQRKQRIRWEEERVVSE